MWFFCTLVSQTQVKFPSRETVFDYWLDPETGAFEQWTKSPYFFSIDYDSRATPMTQVGRHLLVLTAVFDNSFQDTTVDHAS